MLYAAIRALPFNVCNWRRNSETAFSSLWLSLHLFKHSLHVVKISLASSRNISTKSASLPSKTSTLSGNSAAEIFVSESVIFCVFSNSPSISGSATTLSSLGISTSFKLLILSNKLEFTSELFNSLGVSVIHCLTNSIHSTNTSN